MRSRHQPDFGDQIVYIIPRQRTVGNTPPPAHKVCWGYVRVRMEMTCYRDLVVAKRRSNEADSEL